MEKREKALKDFLKKVNPDFDFDISSGEEIISEIVESSEIDYELDIQNYSGDSHAYGDTWVSEPDEKEIDIILNGIQITLFDGSEVYWELDEHTNEMILGKKLFDDLIKYLIKVIKYQDKNFG